MNSDVQAFLYWKEKEYKELKEEDNKRFFERVQLVKKIYMDEEEHPTVSMAELIKIYPYYEYVNNKQRRYRLEYPKFSDEEIDMLKEAQAKVDSLRIPEEPKTIPTRVFASKLAFFLVVLAVAVMVIALITGIEMGTKSVTIGEYFTYTKKEFEFTIAVIYWGAGLFAGSVMLGFAHIVEHLNRQTLLLKTLLQKK